MIRPARAQLALAGFALAVFALEHVEQGLAPTAARSVRATRRQGRFNSLTGAWTGMYRYPDPDLPGTPFNALIEEHLGVLKGSTMEPDMFIAGAVVTATLTGLRQEMDVSFTKQMDGSGGMTHAIHYVGIADADLMRVEGTRRIPGEWGGTFFMERHDASAEESATRSASAGA